jgi:hypothetical protein
MLNKHFEDFKNIALIEASSTLKMNTFGCKLCEYNGDSKSDLEGHVLGRHNDIFVVKYDLLPPVVKRLKKICQSLERTHSGNEDSSFDLDQVRKQVQINIAYQYCRVTKLDDNFVVIFEASCIFRGNWSTCIKLKIKLQG